MYAPKILKALKQKIDPTSNINLGCKYFWSL